MSLLQNCLFQLELDLYLSLDPRFREDDETGKKYFYRFIKKCDITRGQKQNTCAILMSVNAKTAEHLGTAKRSRTSTIMNLHNQSFLGKEGYRKNFSMNICAIVLPVNAKTVTEKPESLGTAKRRGTSTIMNSHDISLSLLAERGMQGSEVVNSYERRESERRDERE